MEQLSLNDTLMHAIERHDLAAIQACLAAGADPNYTRPVDGPGGVRYPPTPLCVVIFCISDCLLVDDDLRQFAAIAALLLQHGADPAPAMALAEERYGKYDPQLPSSPFLDVWHLIARSS
jgi:hypothetical protein